MPGIIYKDTDDFAVQIHASQRYKLLTKEENPDTCWIEAGNLYAQEMTTLILSFIQSINQVVSQSSQSQQPQSQSLQPQPHMIIFFGLTFTNFFLSEKWYTFPARFPVSTRRFFIDISEQRLIAQRGVRDSQFDRDWAIKYKQVEDKWGQDNNYEFYTFENLRLLLHTIVQVSIPSNEVDSSSWG